MSPEFWRAVDRVNVSLYPGRELSAEKQALCVERATASGTTLQFKKYHEFRESYSETGTSDPLLVRAIFDSCEIVHRWRCHTVADGRFYKCPQSYMLPKLVEGCHGNESVDSIAIDDSETFGHDLLWFLQSPEPLATCANCLGSAGRRFEHQQVRRREFRVLQQAPTEELIDPALLAPLS